MVPQQLDTGNHAHSVALRVRCDPAWNVHSVTMKPAIDLFVADLDGTLIRADGTVSEEARTALNALLEGGIDVLVATGRSLAESKPILSQVAYRGLVIAAGGSMLCEYLTGHTLRRYVLDPDIAGEVSRELVSHGHRALLLKDTDVTGIDYVAVGPHPFDMASSWWFSEHHSVIHSIDRIEEDPFPGETIRVGAIAPSRALEQIAEELSSRLGARACLQHWPAVTECEATGSDTHLLEVFAPGVNKWTMVQEYAHERGVPISRIAAIGDGLNDVELIQGVGLGIAVANADARVRDVADRMTSGAGGDGVVEAARAILEDRWTMDVLGYH